MKDELDKLVSRNGISQVELYRLVYDTLLLNLFLLLCDAIHKEGIRQTVLAELRCSQSPIQKMAIIRRICHAYTGCTLSQEECERMLIWMKAHLRKTNRRANYPERLRVALLQKQEYKCPSCKEVIDIGNSMLDHKIPWKLVGDELEDNLQMLCRECNLQKGADVLYAFRMLLVNKCSDSQPERCKSG